MPVIKKGIISRIDDPDDTDYERDGFYEEFERKKLIYLEK